MYNPGQANHGEQQALRQVCLEFVGPGSCRPDLKAKNQIGLGMSRSETI